MELSELLTGAALVILATALLAGLVRVLVRIRGRAVARLADVEIKGAPGTSCP